MGLAPAHLHVNRDILAGGDYIFITLNGDLSNHAIKRSGPSNLSDRERIAEK